MPLRNPFLMLLLAAWLVWMIILMFRDQKCEKLYSEGSIPAMICPAPSDPSDSPSLFFAPQTT